MYDPATLLIPLKRIWKAANLPCSKRLKAIIPEWLPGYIKSYGPISEKTAAALFRTSPSSIDRILIPVRAEDTKHGRDGVRGGGRQHCSACLFHGPCGRERGHGLRSGRFQHPAAFIERRPGREHIVHQEKAHPCNGTGPLQFERAVHVLRPLGTR